MRPAFLLRRRSLRWLEALLRVARSGLQMLASHCTLSPPRHVVRSPTGLLWRLRPVPFARKTRQSFSLRAGKQSHGSGVYSCEFWYDPRATSCFLVCPGVRLSSLRRLVIPGGLSHIPRELRRGPRQSGEQSSPIGHVSKHGPRSIACVQV